MEEKYGEYLIIYNEVQEKFIVQIGQSHLRSSRLIELKKRIDKYTKDQKHFKRIPVLIKGRSGYGAEFEKADITSITDKLDYKRQPEVWIVTENKERSKVSLSSLYVDTTENWEIIKKAKALDAKINELSKQKKSLLGKLTLVELPKENS